MAVSAPSSTANDVAVSSAPAVAATNDATVTSDRFLKLLDMSADRRLAQREQLGCLGKTFKLGDPVKDFNLVEIEIGFEFAHRE